MSSHLRYMSVDMQNICIKKKKRKEKEQPNRSLGYAFLVQEVFLPQLLN